MANAKFIATTMPIDIMNLMVLARSRRKFNIFLLYSQLTMNEARLMQHHFMHETVQRDGFTSKCYLLSSNGTKCGFRLFFSLYLS